MSSASTDSVHGHEIMQMLADAQPAMNRAQLEAEVIKRYGPDARFHTCAAENLTLEDLMNFLTKMGKVVDQDGGLRRDLGKVCDH